jgi:hypothetical protein
MEIIINVQAGIASRQEFFHRAFKEMFPKSGVKFLLTHMSNEGLEDANSNKNVVALRSLDKEIKSYVIKNPDANDLALYRSRYEVALSLLSQIFDYVLSEELEEFLFIDMEYLEAEPETALESVKDFLQLDLQKNPKFSVDLVSSKLSTDFSERRGNKLKYGYKYHLKQTEEQIDSLDLSEISSSYLKKLAELQEKYDAIVEKAYGRVVAPNN